MGTCLCPCCLIPKSRVHQIATEMNMLQWKLLQCSDTKEWCDKVIAAHRLIYEAHYAVHTSQVEELLKSESLVPTLVKHSSPLLQSDNLQLLIECLFRKAQCYQVWSVPYAGSWPSSWIWAGGVESHIYPLIETSGCLEAKHGSWTRSLVEFSWIPCNFSLGWHCI